MKNKGRHGHYNLDKLIRLCIGRNLFSCWIRTFIILLVLTFVYIQVNFGNFYWAKYLNENSAQPAIPGEKLTSTKSESVVGDNENKNINAIPRNVAEIREKIKLYNEEQNVINEETYGLLKNDSLVMVIQVHNRITYLRYLIESLSKAKDINQVLLVFSHDVYDSNINELIQSITFCKVIQIFLQYSIEAYPDQFPGTDPRDCSRDIGKERALTTKCLGAEHPDKYGHYREAKYTQIKHHWWWKLNYVFNHLKITKAYTGLVTFLEEDHYVAEDFIYILKAMNKKCDQLVDCKFLGLGFHVNVKSYGPMRDVNQVKMSSLATNLGLTFNRTTFNIILKCAKQFCEFDDYNWDWSLNYINQICGDTKYRSMIPVAPRLFHTGECGTHIQEKDCKGDAIIIRIQQLLSNAKNKLYPSTITVVDSPTTKNRIIENGGWGDTRDHELCINMTKR